MRREFQLGEKPTGGIYKMNLALPILRDPRDESQIRDRGGGRISLAWGWGDFGSADLTYKVID